VEGEISAQKTQTSDNNNVVKAGLDFFEEMGHNAVVTPIEGATQFVGRLAGKDIEFQTPAAVETGGLDGVARKAGAAIGSAIPFVAAALLTRRFLPMAAESPLTAFGAGAGLGFSYDTVFHPVYGSTENYWTNKLQNASVTALTVGTMSALAPTTYGAVGRWSAVSNGALTGLKTGLAGGFVNAEGDSLIKYHRFAGIDKLTSTTLTYGLTGVALGGIGGLMSESNVPNDQTKPATAAPESQAELPWFRRTKPNGDPEPIVSKGENGRILILDGRNAYSFADGKWNDGILFSHDQIAEFTPVKSQQQVYMHLDQAEGALRQAAEEPKK
jgi:hypothetical protein